jgi:hypothetical protein
MVNSVAPHPDHAEILRSGPTAWNAWRHENPSIVPDLVGIALKLNERQMGPINGGPINLKSARLQDAMLRFATLSAAELEAADLSGSDLVHARFDRANLRAANLSSAQLDHANFTAANLTNATLCGASLSFANLTAADLEAADMTGSSLAHARFDQANLRAANFSDALLDHADFAGANLANANLCGASLYHAKNLTETQLEETLGNDSTILPPHLRGSVSWSVAKSLAESPALERLRLRAPHTVHVVPQMSSHRGLAWIAGVLLIGGALVTGFVWHQMNEALPLDTSDAKSELEQSLSDSKLRSDPEAEKLQPSTHEAMSEENAAAEHQPSADAQTSPIPPPVNTVGRTEIAPEQNPVSDAAAPDVTSLQPGLQASDGAKWSGEGSGTDEHAPNPEPRANESAEASPLVPPEAASATSRHGTVPDVLTHAARPDLTPTTNTPASAFALSTPEQSPASPLSATVPPPVETPALPSSEMVPHRAEPPLPVRKPVIQKGEVSNPDQGKTIEATGKPREVGSNPDQSRRPKSQRFVDKRTTQKSVNGWVADLLAGGF